jgi:hypothetical protein
VHKSRLDQENQRGGARQNGQGRSMQKPIEHAASSTLRSNTTWGETIKN